MIASLEIINIYIINIIETTDIQKDHSCLSATCLVYYSPASILRDGWTSKYRYENKNV